MRPSEFEPWESTYTATGCRYIAGVDEVGRGCIAGPVVAAAVILPSHHSLLGIADSKKLSPSRREAVFPHIMSECLAFGIGIVAVEVIDTINILQASLLAMHHAVSRLRVVPDMVLVDGRDKIPNVACRQEALIDGDNRCLSIAAASIIAKVTRDRLMSYWHRDYPHYGFAAHKGYGTAEHRAALAAFGVTALHRRSFAPVSALIKAQSLESVASLPL